MSFKTTLIGLLTTITGCTTPYMTSEVRENLVQLTSSIKDPHNVKSVLEDNEHIVEYEVMQIFAQTINYSFFTYEGVYLSKNFLDTTKERDDFLDKLIEKGYSKKEANTYLTLFSTPKTIIVTDRAIKDKSTIFSYLAHERFHQEMKKLSPQDYALMNETAQKIIQIRIPKEGDSLKRGKVLLQEVSKTYGADVAKVYESDFISFNLVPEKIRMGSSEELYTYTATNPTTDSISTKIEQHIQKTPRVWEIYSTIKERVLDLEGYDKDVPLEKCVNE